MVRPYSPAHDLAPTAARSADRAHLRADGRQQRHRPRDRPRPRRPRRARRVRRARRHQGRPRRRLAVRPRLHQRRRAGRLGPRLRRDRRQAAAGAPRGPVRSAVQRRRHGRSAAVLPPGPRAPDRHQPPRPRRARHRPVAGAARQRRPRGDGLQHRRPRRPAVADDDPRAARLPEPVRRAAGLPELQAGQPAVRPRAAPARGQGRLAGELDRRAPGCELDQPVRPPARGGRPRLPRAPVEGRHQDRAAVRGRRGAADTAGARPQHPSGAFVGPTKLGQFRGRPELLEVYPSAQDPATAARLWELTEQVLGVPLPL